VPQNSAGAVSEFVKTHRNSSMLELIEQAALSWLSKQISREALERTSDNPQILRGAHEGHCCQANIVQGCNPRGRNSLRARSSTWHARSCSNGSEKTDPKSMRVNELRQRRGYNRATVAVANKNARIIWAVLTSGHLREPRRPGRLSLRQLSTSLQG
jgi:hypothetical protein